MVDVSGDGAENCNPRETVDEVRDDLVANGATVNGLPILEGDEADTLEAWYRTHLIGGDGSFLVPALGFEDFERAMHRKFITEVSRLPAALPSSGKRAGSLPPAPRPPPPRPAWEWP